MPSEKPGSGADEELEDALGTFDGEILAEREVFERRSNETANDSGAAGNGPGPAATGAESPGGGAGTGPAKSPSDSVAMPIPSSRPPPPMPVASAPDDIPDAQDDDILARQLREAAMAESDPQLREALWEEYRRYKGS